eukprot:12212957-Alexandrium_andersonii.AAC.1
MVQHERTKRSGDAVSLRREAGSGAAQHRSGGGCETPPNASLWRAGQHEVAPGVGIHGNLRQAGTEEGSRVDHLEAAVA